MPLPLVASDLDGHVRCRSIALRQQGLRRGDGHTDEDEERDDRPDHFDGGIFVEVRSLVPDRFSVLPDGVEHRPEHQHEDDQTDDQDPRMQIIDVVPESRLRGLQVQLHFCMNQLDPAKKQGGAYPTAHGAYLHTITSP